MGIWANYIVTIFTTLPTFWQWATLLAGTLLLCSWFYLVLAVRSLPRGMSELLTEVCTTADRLSGISLEQQGELLRRMGWAVTYLEHIEQKLGYTTPPHMQVSSITAENIVVRPSIRESVAHHGGNGN